MLTRGSLATRDQLPAKLRNDPLKFEAPQLLTFPDAFPNGLANRATLRAFSELWYRKAPRRQRGAIQNITAFYQVLDLFGDWNRVYGSRGFLQYQFLVPSGEEPALRRIVEKIGASRHASGLNVLKRFGAGNQAPLSFPQPGWTITVDFPIAAGPAPASATSSTGWCSRPGGGSTWRRSHGRPVRPSSGATPGSRSGARSATRPTPTASSSPTWHDGWS